MIDICKRSENYDISNNCVIDIMTREPFSYIKWYKTIYINNIDILEELDKGINGTISEDLFSIKRIEMVKLFTIGSNGFSGGIPEVYAPFIKDFFGLTNDDISGQYDISGN